MTPMRFRAGLVPDLARLGDVVVFLGVVRAVISGGSQILRKQPPTGRQTNLASHVLSTEAGRMHAGDDRRARRSTDGRIGPAASIDRAAARERVQMRSRGVGIAIAAQVRAVIFTGQPDDVRPFRSNQLVGDNQPMGPTSSAATRTRESHWMTSHLPRLFSQPRGRSRTRDGNRGRCGPTIRFPRR